MYIRARREADEFVELEHDGAGGHGGGGGDRGDDSAHDPLRLEPVHRRDLVAWSHARKRPFL